MMVRHRIFLISCAAALALAGCTKSYTSQKTANGLNPWTIAGTLRIGIPDEPDNLNPMFAHTAETDEVDQLIFAPLFRYDDHGEFYPELATVLPSYRNGGISADGRTITIHMRRGVKWADGAPLTARDFRFMYRAVMNNANNTKLRFGWDNVASLTLPDDYTIVVRLKAPNADFLGNLASGGAAYPPLPEHLLAKLSVLNHANFNSAPLSSGPWILQKWNHGSSLEFIPNPKYWRGPPKLDHLTLRVLPNADTQLAQLQTHEIDVYPGVNEDQIDRVKSIPGIVAQQRLVANWRHVAFNTRRPTLSDQRVRLAIAEAINWDRILSTIYHGVNIRAHSDVYPKSWAAPKIPLYKYDPNDARRLLQSAGWTMGSDGVLHKGSLSMHVTLSATTATHANEQTEVQIQQDLKPLGIAIEIKNYPTSLMFAQSGPLYTGNYDMEWSIDTNGPDPDNEGLWSGRFIPPKGADTTWTNDPIINQTSHAAVLTYDRAQRKALYQEEEDRIHELVPAIFVYWENQYNAWNSDLRNYKPAPFIANNWNSWQWEMGPSSSLRTSAR
ncbi:MAG: peptide ABC transporter substrate-binding protein [Candidatus Eremiobacteraeota bacterium]|nr:peptide ABC transporter substrate-binding protein [Candidatus Eremiobacteraeota bacterium]